MTERPILFTGKNVRRILGGQKTQTRRVVRPQPPAGTEWDEETQLFVLVGSRLGIIKACPFGRPGDRLYVRETWTAHWHFGRTPPPADRVCTEGEVRQSDGTYARITASDPLYVYYRADHDELPMPHLRWQPSIHMPKWASRLWLEVKRIRVERLQAITDADALAEGVGSAPEDTFDSARDEFAASWDEINAERGFGWDVNPWVWVVDFEVSE